MTIDILPILAALLTLFIPGTAISFTVLSGTAFGRIDKLLFGLIAGILIIPTISFVEYALLGLRFNAALVLFNSALALAASVAAYYLRTGAWPIPRLGRFKPTTDWLKNNWPNAVLLILIVVAFYIRFAPAWSTTFYEFDPYYYEKLTERLVNNGQIDLFSSDSYFPEKAFQRWQPLPQYLAGSWVTLYQLFSGHGYEKETLILISQIYPPLVGALLCFVAFIFIREEFNTYFGLVAAGLMAFTPQMVKKFGAGVAEQQPWGLFMALLVLALILIALKRQSYKVGLLAALAMFGNIFGSQQYIWPTVVLAGFIGIQSVLYYLSDTFQSRKWFIIGAVTLAAVIGNAVMAIYQQQQYIQFTQPQTMALLGAFVFGSLLFYAAKHFKLQGAYRWGFLAAFAVVGIGAVALSSDFYLFASRLLGLSSTAFTTGALGQTIAEEGRTVEGLFEPAYGVLNPTLLLAVAALATLLTAAVSLFRKKHVKTAAVLSLLGLAFIFLNPLVDNGVQALFSGIANPEIKSFIDLFVTNNVFGYLFIALISVSAAYLAAAEEFRTESTLLVVLVLFPVAFIGLNKLKFIVHLGLALVLTLPYVLGESQRLAEQLNEWLKVFSNRARFQMGIVVLLMMVGSAAVVAQARTVPTSVNELELTRMPPDWVDAYKWMRASTPTDIRVMSWWDYGHWTTFLGNRNTVLNPSNLYGNFDHGVARAFVDGNPNDLYDRMEFHNATHILVDGDLIGKWGALVYLSGTCSKTNAPICPLTPEIDQTKGPGQSRYEVEHYFENLAIVGNCPAAVVGVPLPLLQSSLGARYCLTNDQMIYLTSQGQMSNVSRPYKLAGRDAITQIDSDTAYLFSVGRNQFINVNPYYEPFGLHNNVFFAAFTQLFFFDSLPGFKRVYSSQNGYVKIFEYSGRPTAQPVTLATPTPPQTRQPQSMPTIKKNTTISGYGNETELNSTANVA